MSDDYQVPYINRPVVGEVRPPGSKSITNRALICAAMADGVTRLQDALDSEDTQVMQNALLQLGIDVRWDGPDLVVDGGIEQIGNPEEDLFVANSGTTIRFLSAMLAAVGGKYTLDGIQRMRERPIAHLKDALVALGVSVECDANGCPPISIDSVGFVNQSCQVSGDISSQYLSGLLMAAPAASQAIVIEVEGELVSTPYIDITTSVMSSFGVVVQASSYNQFEIEGGSKYRPCVYSIEPDASAASYFFALAAVTGGKITVMGLSRDAIQGDIGFLECLVRMGCIVDYGPNSITVEGRPLNGIDVDMNGISDTVPTLGVVSLFANGPTNIRNVEHVRHKETDRITDLANELRKLGARVVERQDGMVIHPGELIPAAIDTYNDHRMAMSFAVAGLLINGTVIKNPMCCEKTYPKFFSDLESLLA